MFEHALTQGSHKDTILDSSTSGTLWVIRGQSFDQSENVEMSQIMVCFLLLIVCMLSW